MEIINLCDKVIDINKSVVTKNNSNQSEVVIAIQKQKLNELTFVI